MEILISGREVMARVLRHLLASAESSDPPPALFMHCTTGNNRTGVFIAVLLRLLNVPKEYVVREYTLSDVGLAATRHVNVERLLKKGAFKEFGKVEARRKCERMVGARAESMEALLEEADERWGEAEGYFLDVVGLTKEEIERVREILTAEGAGELGGPTVESNGHSYRTLPHPMGQPG
jgi:protein tyrosine/serine phosphatase